MARDEAAKRLGAPVAALAGLRSRNRTDRALMISDEVIMAWRASVRDLAVRDADRSLLAFAGSSRAH